MTEFFHVLHIFIALGLVGLILIQHGKGADAGAAFGSGASSTVFGSQGSGSFLTRSTAILAVIFFVTNLVLAYLSSQVAEPESVIQEVTEPAPLSLPTEIPVLPEAGNEVPTIPVVPAKEEAASAEIPVAPATQQPAPVDAKPVAAETGAAPDTQ